MRPLARVLFALYPPSFRREHGDEWRQAVGAQSTGFGVSAALIVDTLKAAPPLWGRTCWQSLSHHRVAVALALMVMPVAFLSAVAMEQLLGAPRLMDVIYPADAPGWRVTATDLLVIVPPFLVVALVAASVVRVRSKPGGGRAVVVDGALVFDYVVIAGALAMAALFVGYGLVENWACLFGGATTC